MQALPLCNYSINLITFIVYTLYLFSYMFIFFQFLIFNRLNFLLVARHSIR
ncbi:hypothetical protein FM106_15245 [Brachybacterium faecium]|nr:hypothetical protein FM106_15245 [Brachybacterium faecium]